MIFLSLGCWQLNRAYQKEALEISFQNALSGEAILLNDKSEASKGLETVRASATGRFDRDRQLLLDNQSRDRVPGYRVWTPLRLETGGLVMVDRGWVPADPHRDRLPNLNLNDSGPRSVTGFWRRLPQPAIRLESDPCADPRFPRVVNYPTIRHLGCIYKGDVGGGDIAEGLLLMDAKEPDGFVREWTMPNPVPPARHYAYAAQWFAFAATLLGIFFWLGFGPGRKKEPQ